MQRYFQVVGVKFHLDGKRYWYRTIGTIGEDRLVGIDSTVTVNSPFTGRETLTVISEEIVYDDPDNYSVAYVNVKLPGVQPDQEWLRRMFDHQERIKHPNSNKALHLWAVVAFSMIALSIGMNIIYFFVLRSIMFN